MTIQLVFHVYNIILWAKNDGSENDMQVQVLCPYDFSCSVKPIKKS